MQSDGIKAEKQSGKTSMMATLLAIMTFLACNGVFILVAVFAALGITLTINPHLQAAAITLFALITLVVVFVNYRKNKLPGPIILCTIGAVTVIGTMYIHYDKIVESIGLLELFIGAIWSWRASR
jgi:hypothetical protein